MDLSAVVGWVASFATQHGIGGEFISYD